MEELKRRLESAMGPMPARELADKSSVTKQTIYNLLDGVTSADKVRAVTIFAIASALDVLPEWLLFGKQGQVVQTARPSPATLRAAHEFLHTAFNFPGKEFDITTDAELFANAYEWISQTPPTERKLANFSAWLRHKKIKPKAARKVITAGSSRSARAKGGKA